MKGKDKLRLVACNKALKTIREVISEINLPLEGTISHKLTGCCIKLNAVMATLENVLKSL